MFRTDDAGFVEAELAPGELVYDAGRDLCTFHLTFPGHVIGHELEPREWMAMARAMVEAARAARAERVKSL